MPMAAMARREQELGYPSLQPHHTSSPGVGFTLPSISDINLRPDAGDSTPEWVSLPKLGGGREMVSPRHRSSSIKEGKRPERVREDKRERSDQDPDENEDHPSREATLTPPTTPTSIPTPAAAKAPTPSPRLFSTWLPDDSLPFIQPRLLSDAEKETLERRMSETKSPPGSVAPLPPNIGDPGGTSTSTSHAQAIPSSPSPTQRHLPRPKNLQVPPTHPSPDQELEKSQPPYLSPLSTSSYRRPNPLRRAHTTDLELLRQVKSNNLTLPSSNLSAMTHTTTDRYRGPDSLPMLSPFTRTPLSHPQSRTQPHQHQHQHPGYDTRASSTHTQSQARSRPRVLHPPPPPMFKETQKRPYPYALEPLSPRSFHSSSSRDIHMSHSWPRSELRYPSSASEDVRGGHPYSREPGMSRVRGGHGFRHQR